MTHLMRPNFRAFPIAFALVAGICGWSTTAFAQSAQAPTAIVSASPLAPDTMRLTDEQREAILDANTEEDAATARGEATESERLGPGIHGEVGVMIGSNGTRGIYGTADIPLGDNAGATISFENSRYGYRRSRPSPR